MTDHEAAQVRGRGFTDQDIRLLFARRQRILARLSVVSHGTTTAPVDHAGFAGKGRADNSTAMGRALADAPRAHPPRVGASAPPPGVKQHADMTVRDDGPPSRDRDLHGHYLHRFQRARGDLWAIEKLCAQAERDLEREIRSKRNPTESSTTRDKRIIEEYCGLPPWEVATWEGISPESVRKLRREMLLNPEDGIETEMDPRTARIVELKREGKSQRSIAQVLGIGVATVNRTLAGVR